MLSPQWKEPLLQAAFPLVTAGLLTLYVLFCLLTNSGYSVDELLQLLQYLFDSYGHAALLLAAFVEGIYMVNLYFPGSAVIAAAVLFSNKTLPELALITLICWVAFMAATVVNYTLGRYGFYKTFKWLGGQKTLENTHKWLERNGWWAMFVTAFHPNYLAISSVCMGIGKEGLQKTLLLAGLGMSISGPILTALTTFFIESVVADSERLFYLMIALFYVWGFYLFTKTWLKERKNQG